MENTKDLYQAFLFMKTVTMKIALALLVLLPLAFSVQLEERSLLNLGFPHLIDIQFIKNKVQEILDKVGSDASEQQCEATCHNVFTVDESHLIHKVCSPLCRSFQTLVNVFGLRPHASS
ncbi:uncharacterized protein LOC143282634 [Babylonia areolata]|uniref:uncharacterized protein LOC143282634 n=1 Tax=Babylonia areolata TaxID=304850 RepID=UPI003FD4A6AF